MVPDRQYPATTVTSRSRPGSHQSGVALLTILLLAVLASVLLTDMLSRHELNIAQTRHTIHQQEGLAHALGAESWVRHVLQRDLLEDERDPQVDSLQDPWALPEPQLELPGAGDLEVEVRALDGLFNLNTIANDAAALDRFRRLLTSLDLDPVIAEQVRDWTNPGEDAAPSQELYLSQDPPYRAPRQPMASITELRLLDAMDQEGFARLAPYVAALPAAVSGININTAPPPVLAMLAPEMDPRRAGEYAYPEPPWNMPGDLLGQEAGFAPEQGVLATRSRFFEARIQLRTGNQLTRLRSVIYRDPATGVTTVTERDMTGHESRPLLPEGWPDEEF